jgi:PhnB protein
MTTDNNTTKSSPSNLGSPSSTATAAEQQIKALVESWRTAAKAADVPRTMSHYTPDIVAFDAVQQLQFLGAAAYGKHWAMCMEMCPGPMIFDVDALAVETGGDVGFAHFLMRCGKQDEHGEEKASWMRVTQGYRRTNGNWAIAHEHFSAPFDMESGKALFDLKP